MHEPRRRAKERKGLDSIESMQSMPFKAHKSNELLLYWPSAHLFSFKDLHVLCKDLLILLDVVGKDYPKASGIRHLALGFGNKKLDETCIDE